MLTGRLQEVTERAATLPAENQDAVAEVLSGLLADNEESWPAEAPALPPELDAIVHESMRQNVALLEYLKDKQVAVAEAIRYLTALQVWGIKQKVVDTIGDRSGIGRRYRSWLRAHVVPLPANST
jgi:hypothetical protein